MGEIGEAFEDAEQFLVPGPAQDLHVARPARRAEWPEPRKVVATLRGWRNGEAAPDEVPGSAGLPRVLAEPDADPVACGGAAADGGPSQAKLFSICFWRAWWRITARRAKSARWA